MVRGRVLGSGNEHPECNVGFTSTRLRRGDYRVVYDVPFGSGPVVVATARAGRRITRIVTIRNAGGNRRDAAFNFIAEKCERKPNR
jgi:hypothetical protein